MTQAWAYDQTGNTKVLHPIAVNSEVEWKRQGVRGSYRARVVGLTETKAKIQLISYSDRPLLDLSDRRPIWVKLNFIHVFDRPS